MGDETTRLIRGTFSTVQFFVVAYIQLYLYDVNVVRYFLASNSIYVIHVASKCNNGRIEKFLRGIA